MRMKKDRTKKGKGGAEEMSRSQALRQIAGAGLCLPLSGALYGSSVVSDPPPLPDPNPQSSKFPDASARTPFTLSPEDDQFLNELENASFQFFWEQGNPKTGMVQDRADVHGGPPGIVASICACTKAGRLVDMPFG